MTDAAPSPKIDISDALRDLNENLTRTEISSSYDTSRRSLPVSSGRNLQAPERPLETTDFQVSDIGASQVQFEFSCFLHSTTSSEILPVTDAQSHVPTSPKSRQDVHNNESQTNLPLPTSVSSVEKISASKPPTVSTNSSVAGTSLHPALAKPVRRRKSNSVCL